MASRLKRKQGAVIVSASDSHGLCRGMFSLHPPQSSTRDAQKKRKSKQACVKRTITPYFDGHLWRKYGQKTIKDAPYPRLYFRCSYREDKHCMASKLVQQVNDQDPPLFEVTYTYEHTCNAEPVPPPDVGDAAEPPPAACDGFVLSFGSSGGGVRAQHRDALMMPRKRKDKNQCQSVPPAQFSTMHLDSWNGQLREEPTAFLFRADLPPAVSSWPSPFLSIAESSSESSSMSNSEDYLFPTVDWDSSSGLIDQFDDHSRYLGTTSSWETDGCSFAHLGVQFEGKMIF